MYYLPDERLNHIPLTNDDIPSQIRSLNINKSSGPDEISARMLMLCDATIVLPLKLIFTNILSTGMYPEMCKLANVTPIKKKGSKQLITNYRPISLLPICGKIFERIIFKHLCNYLVSNDLITKNQSGFRPGDSTVNQLLIGLVNDIHKSFDQRKPIEVRAVFLDISKALIKFGMMDWFSNLNKMVYQYILKLLKNYLQRVVLNGSTSDISSTESGVSQGSVLDPIIILNLYQ